MASARCVRCGALVPPGAGRCPACGEDPTTPSGASRRYWEAFDTAPAVRARRPRRRRVPAWLVAVGAVCVGALLLEAGFLGGWFGSAPAPASAVPRPTPPGSPGPDPNPYREAVTSVVGTVTYTGNLTGYLSGVNGTPLCARCPVVPTENDRYDPPVASFFFFFNLTNVGSEYHTFGNFSLTTLSGSNASLFVLGGVFCCYPNYGEDSDAGGLVPAQSLGVMVFVYAATVPDRGGAGYALGFGLTSSD